jgi:hypothetical protein
MTLPNTYINFPILQSQPKRLGFFTQMTENVWQFILFSVYSIRFFFPGTVNLKKQGKNKKLILF